MTALSVLQPVHNSGSSGYRSLNSTDQLLGMTSSSESLNNGTKLHQEDDEEEEVSSKTRPVSLCPFYTVDPTGNRIMVLLVSHWARYDAIFWQLYAIVLITS